ncbi:hypothetical protein GKZ90_0007620 [Flavobacterium sp. MC2016-06]|uniref:hypothetical protein n=1 Tax=Flavobacterium sp. MC2016-06 TaxID=2676308 RepID=UPI0012BB198C|nr:hypothetical protein [Flavobacterium sp. MC2016-06]MBU3858103.1 hypothetical protein [Flavobacterium sp. MC2016-06]
MFLFCISLYAKETHSVKETPIVSELVSLNDSQKKILYQFAVLQKNGSDANAYWLKNKNQFSAFNDNARDQLANEIFINSHLLYTPVKDSSIQIWMQAQSLTNWMLYLAAIIAVCAIIGLLRNYWNLLIEILIKQFAPLFRLLFSAILLTYELLFIGIACIVGGCLIHDMVFRTAVIHVGLFLLWSQSTAIFTKKYLVEKYIFEIKDNFWKNDKWEAVKTISFPAVLVTIAIWYMLYKVPQDVLYNYEIVISSIVAIYALPFWRILEKYIYPVLIPFKDENVERGFSSLAACTVLALIVDVVFVFQKNSLFTYLITALTTLLILSFLILSLKENYKYNYKNYYYLQFITVAFFGVVLLYSFHVQSAEIIWVSLIGISIFVIIKYWEIPTFFITWKRKNSWIWGFLGMAALLWLMAKGILYITEVLYAV